MYIMYVDESGDSGLVNSPTNYFALSGLVVHESRWRSFLEILIAFRKTMYRVYGLPVRGEIHASEFINRKAFNLDRYVRLSILRNCLDELSKIDFIMITNVIVEKENKPNDYNIFERAWLTLFQRFENTLQYGNFPGAHRLDHGFTITDATAGKKLTQLVRRMAVYNPIPNDAVYGTGSRNVPITRIIEDPYGKDSSTTLPIQMCDVIAYFLMQRFSPNSYIKRTRSQNYFDRLRPILNHNASRNNPLGIVRI